MSGVKNTVESRSKITELLDSTYLILSLSFIPTVREDSEKRNKSPPALQPREGTTVTTVWLCIPHLFTFLFGLNSAEVPSP